MVFGRGTTIPAPGNGRGETPHLTVTTQSKKAEVGIQTLIGDYVERGMNHGKKYFQKAQKIEGHEDVKVFLYYWDKRDGEEFSGWWFGDQLGGSQVWARSPAHTPTPPRVGWKIPWDAPKADLGALFVDPYKPGSTPASAASAAAGAAARASSAGPGKGLAVRPPAVAAGGAAGVSRQPSTAPPVPTNSSNPKVQNAIEQIDAAEAGAKEALEQAKEVMAGNAPEDALKQVQEMLQKQKLAVCDLPKNVMMEINDAKKLGPSGAGTVGELARLLPKARTLQASMTTELNKIQSQVVKAISASAANRKKEEMQEQKKQMEEKDEIALSEQLPAVLEQVSLAEDAVEGLAVLTEPLIANPLEGDSLKRALEEVETAVSEAQEKVVEARKITSEKLQAARKYAPGVQKTATTEYSALQQKLNEAQKRLAAFKSFRQNYKSRVDAKKALADMNDKMDEADLEVEKASLMTSAAGQGQMSEDEISNAEKIVGPAMMAIVACLKAIEARLRNADGAMRLELADLKDRGVQARKKIDSVSTLLRQQREGQVIQQAAALALERVEKAEAALHACHEAETPFLKGIEVLPAEESNKAIAECEAAASKAEGVINAAKLFCKNKLADMMRKPKDLTEAVLDELKALAERAEAAGKKLGVFRGETLERKVAAKLADILDALAAAEAKSVNLVAACKVFQGDGFESLSTQALEEAVAKAQAAEKETVDACMEVKRAMAVKQKETKGDLGAAMQKLQGRLNVVAQELGKQKRSIEGGSKLIMGKAIISEEEERITAAECQVVKVEKVIEAAGSAKELSDAAIRELSDSALSAQRELKASSATINHSIPGSQLGVKAALQKLLERIKKASEKLNVVLSNTKDQREKVMAEVFVQDAEKKVEEVEASLERVNQAELPFLKGLECLPLAEAKETLQESDAAADAVQKAISEARNYIATKNLEVKQYRVEVASPAQEQLAKHSERVNVAANKLAQFRKDTEGRKRTAQAQEIVERVDAVEEEGRGMVALVAPFTDGSMDNMSAEEAYESCTKATAAFTELFKKMDEIRVMLAQRHKDAKGAPNQQGDQLQKAQTRLAEARVEVAKLKVAVTEREAKVFSKKVLLEANEMVDRLDNAVKQVTDFCSPLLEKGCEDFFVATSLRTLATALRDVMTEKELSVEQLFKKIEGQAKGKVPRDAFLSYLEGLPAALEKEHLTFMEERRANMVKSLDPEDTGSVSLEAFKGIFETRYICVKSISMTDSLEVQESKTTAKVEPDDVLEATTNPKVEQATGMSRLECKNSAGKTGYVTMVGNSGTVFIEPLSPFRKFAADMDAKIEETVKNAQEVAAFFAQKSSELAAQGKQASGTTSETRAQLVKMRLKVTTCTTSLENIKKKAAVAKRDFPKKEALDKEAYVDIKERKVAKVVQEGVNGHMEAMESGLKKLDEVVSPLTSVKGAELEAVEDPAGILQAAKDAVAELATTVAEARKLREEQLAKVGKAVRGPFVDLKRELQKMEVKALATLKKGQNAVNAAKAACQSLVDACFGPVATALREEAARKSVSYEDLFSELAKSEEETISEEDFCEHLKGLEGLDVKPAHALLLCRSIADAGGLGKRKFLAFVRQYFAVVKGIAITDGFDVGTAKIVRSAELEEVIEVLEGPKLHEKLNIARIRGKSLADGTEGWVSVKGNQGSTFLQKVPKPCFAITAEVALEEEFRSEGDKVIRNLKPDEVFELMEGPKKTTYPAGLRVRGKAYKDNVVGWFTVRDKKGATFAEPDSKYYSCITSVAMTDSEDIKTCSVLRKLDKGELVVALTEPACDDGSGITRINCKALKDEKVGWITIKGNAGTQYAVSTGKNYTITKEVALQKSFASSSGDVRQLEEGEALQCLESKEEVYPPDVRIKGRVQGDGAVGWITKGNNLKQWDPIYKCLEATPLHSGQSAEGAEVVRELEVGELIEHLEGPIVVEGDVRIKGRAEKDREVGWATVRSADGKRLLGAAS